MPFVQRYIEPKYLSRTTLFDDDGNAKVNDEELQAVTNNTLTNALRQLASLVLVANDIFNELGTQLQDIQQRTETIKIKINVIEEKVLEFDPKKVTVPVSDICTFAHRKHHYEAKQTITTNLFNANTRPNALKQLYDGATKTPIHLMRQMDRWRRDGHRTSRFFLCTPVLGAKRRKIRNRIDIDIETRTPAAVEELRRWTSDEALGDITVTTDCLNRIIASNTNVTAGTVTDGETTDGTIGSDVDDDDGIDHKLPSPEEQLQVIALKFPAEIVAVDISGKSFDRMSIQRRSLLHGDVSLQTDGVESGSLKRRTRSRRPRNRRRNTLAGTDQKEIRDALTAGDENSSTTFNHLLETESTKSGAVIVARSKSSDLLRSNHNNKSKESPTDKKSHFNTLKQWGKNRYDRFRNKSNETKSTQSDDIDDFNIYETVTMKRKRDLDKERRTHERNSSISSSEKSSSINLPVNTLSSVMNIAVKLRDSSAQRRQRRSGGGNNNKDEQPHSSSGNWSASSESGRASIGSEITTTTTTHHPKSSTSCATSSNSLNQQPPSSVNSRRRFNINHSTTSGSVTSEGTLTPDIIHDLHEDETSSVYSCDTEGYYTSFHMDSGLKTLKEEELPPTPLHSTSAFSNSSSNNTVLSAENEYELFGKGSTSTTTSSAGTVCTTLRASESNRSLIIGPAVPERKSSLSKLTNKDKHIHNKSPESSLERDFSDKTGTVKRSPANKKQNDGDVSPDSGHNTSSSPIESINSPNGLRSGSDFEFSESSDMEGPERIERIRVKTTINSSRIPSMCVITPPHSDDESVKSYNRQMNDRNKLDLKFNKQKSKQQEIKSCDSDKENFNIHTRIITTNNKLSIINVNPQSGYATVHPIDDEYNKNIPKSIRAPSPSGGTVTIQEEIKTSPNQPIIKSSLLPLNTMLGKLKTNLVNFAEKRKSKSPIRPSTTQTTEDNNLIIIPDAGEYVTIADVRNNNDKTIPEEVINKNLSNILSGKVREAEYVSLNELPNINNNNNNNNNNNDSTSSQTDSLERKRRQGARVMLDAEGKVVYSSDSLRRRKGLSSTFEPGPFVKPIGTPSPCQSPLTIHRNTPKILRPVTNSQQQRLNNIPQTEFNRPLSPQLLLGNNSKIVIKANATTSSSSEIVRMPPSTIVRPMSPMKNSSSSSNCSRSGAYVHIQESSSSSRPQIDKERVPSPQQQQQQHFHHHHHQQPVVFVGNQQIEEMYNYRDPIYNQENSSSSMYDEYYMEKYGNIYNTLPNKRTQYFQQQNIEQERSVTPDITRGLSRIQQYDTNSVDRRRNFYRNEQVNVPFHTSTPTKQQQTTTAYQSNIIKPLPENRQYNDESDSFKISPIDPRNSGGFQSSTPSSNLKFAINFENKLLSPKKSTMSSEELYAVIHKSKKKMNIATTDELATTNVVCEMEKKPLQHIKSPESGYLHDKSRSRLSWSPTKGEYIDFNADIDKFSPQITNDSRTRQSWACNDRKQQQQQQQQTTRLDFKRLLLQKSNFLNSTKKLSAVEQLKLSKQQIEQQKSPIKQQQNQDMSILELSGSPRSLINRKFNQNTPGSPRNISEKHKQTPKLLSPRSQWRFANPRTDVLSSTKLEDCREDENNSSSSSNNSILNDNNKKIDSTNDVKKSYQSITERIQAQRAQFFNLVGPKHESTSKFNSQFNSKDAKNAPTLETAF